MSPDNENTWTIDAIERGDIDAIKQRVFSDPTYLHDRDDIGDTPLLTAIGSVNIELVRFLLSNAADPNVAVDDGYTCLLAAIESDATDSIAIVDLLINNGADIHATGTNGWTPLHMASAQGHVDKARLLIDAGADVNKRKDIDAAETPLMEAAFAGQPETTRLLLEAGADPSMRDSIHHRTAIEIAVEASKGPDADVVKFLKEENVQVDVDEIFADMDLPADQLAEIKQTMGNLDMAQSYFDHSKQLAESGEHAEVVRILS